MVQHEEVSECKIIIENVTIEARSSDNYINATQLCKVGDKDFYEWYELDTTKEVIKEYEISLNDDKLIVESNSGIWIHPDLALQLASWISPMVSIKVFRWTCELFRVSKELKDVEQNNILNQKKESEYWIDNNDATNAKHTFSDESGVYRASGKYDREIYSEKNGRLSDRVKNNLTAWTSPEDAFEIQKIYKVPDGLNDVSSEIIHKILEPFCMKYDTDTKTSKISQITIDYGRF
jgi:hypothetical protein